MNTYHSLRTGGGRFRRAANGVLGVFAFILVAAGPVSVRAESAWVLDPQDMADSSGDIRGIEAYVLGDHLYLSMSVEGVAGPSAEQTPDGMNNRYYYHWLLDTDNDPATGRSNAEYEGSSTGVQNPVGYDLVVMVGWRDGKPNGVEVYDPLDEDNELLTGFPFQASGNTLTAAVPLEAVGLSRGQTVAVSAFQEGASDGWSVDWMESATLVLDGPELSGAWVEDGADMADSSGDIRAVQAFVMGGNLHLSMTVEGVAGPAVEQTPDGMSNRYYYHWLLDTDNDPATGRSNSEYEGSSTGVQSPVGTELVVMVGWRDGKPNGVEIYDPLDEDNELLTGFPFQASGNTLTAVIPLEAMGLAAGQTVAVSAFQEGASDGWSVDWMESATLVLEGPGLTLAEVEDPADMADSSGDIRKITGFMFNGNLHLAMTVEGSAAPATEQTPDGMSNRYYYHWLLDTDNDPATGRSNSEYEGSSTGVTSPVGTELVIQIGWRDGKPNGVAVYDPLDEDNALLTGFTYQASGNTLTAVIPLEALGLTEGQNIAVSAFQEGASDGWSVDWMESGGLLLEDSAFKQAILAGVDDPLDMADSSGDIKRIEIGLDGGEMVLRMSVYGTILPSVEETPDGMRNRYYYHWLLDTDNDPATGRSNGEYEGSSTGVQDPVGTELVVMIGWRDGAPNGLHVYDPLDEDTALVSDFAYEKNGDTVEVRLPLAALGLAEGQTIAFSAFQEGASDGWSVDWVESAALTLQEGGSGMDLESMFAGDAWGFKIRVTDSEELEVDSETVEVTSGGERVTVEVVKEGGVTTIVGRHPALLEAGSVHTVNLSLTAGESIQARDFVFKVDPYSVLSEGRLDEVVESLRGFVVNATQISSFQTGQGSVHEDKAELAEKQLVGFWEGDISGGYYNEASEELNPGFDWIVEPVVVEDVINWYELADMGDASLNFGNDQLFPKIGFWGSFSGTAVEILTYLELEPGYHKLGLYTEGGHKVNEGLDASGEVLSLWDNSGEVARVPTYFARNQFFNVVVEEAGYYPIRVLWFQSVPDEEPGIMLELFSVADREMHLLNDAEDPLAIRTFRAGPLVDPSDLPPMVSIEMDGADVIVTWTGTLQTASSVDGEWTTTAEEGQSPMVLTMNGGQRIFARAVRSSEGE